MTDLAFVASSQPLARLFIVILRFSLSEVQFTFATQRSQERRLLSGGGGGWEGKPGDEKKPSWLASGDEGGPPPPVSSSAGLEDQRGTVTAVSSVTRQLAFL